MVQQPFASLIAMKVKTIETRMWNRNMAYRGDILIASSKKPKTPDEVRAIMTQEQWNDFNAIRKKLHFDIYGACGIAIAVVNAYDYRDMNKVEDQKEAFVRWQPGLKSICLDNIRPVVSFPVKGNLGLLNVPRETEEKICFG